MPQRHSQTLLRSLLRPRQIEPSLEPLRMQPAARLRLEIRIDIDDLCL